MQFILEGLFFGLTLTILLGPIFIALTQTSIEKGGKAGMTVGLGVWSSDVLIVVGSWYFIKALSTTVESDEFKFWLGLIGGIVMISFGIVAFFTKVKLDFTQVKHSYKNYIGFWLKGFLVNTINPFTFIFWLSVISTYIIGRKVNNVEASLFLGSILFTIVFTDTMKVVLAKMIRTKLKPKHIEGFNKVAGVGLLIFGLFLIWRSWV